MICLQLAALAAYFTAGVVRCWAVLRSANWPHGFLWWKPPAEQRLANAAFLSMRLQRQVAPFLPAIQPGCKQEAGSDSQYQSIPPEDMNSAMKQTHLMGQRAILRMATLSSEIAFQGFLWCSNFGHKCVQGVGGTRSKRNGEIIWGQSSLSVMLKSLAGMSKGSSHYPSSLLCLHCTRQLVIAQMVCSSCQKEV